MKPSLRRIASWLKRLLVAQALVSLLATFIFISGEARSLWYPMLSGLLPIAIVIAFLFRLPYSELLLRTFCAFTVALGGIVLLLTLVESVGSWATPSRLVLSGQVAVGALLLVALSGAQGGRRHRI